MEFKGKPGWKPWNPEKQDRWERWGLRGKTAWEWLDLMIVPVTLALFAGVFTTLQIIYQTQAETQREQIAQEQAAKVQRFIEEFRVQETSLQAYLDLMADLLLQQNLREAEEGSEVRAIAQAQTLTTLRKQDAEGKRTVVLFLGDARLIQGLNPEAEAAWEAALSNSITDISLLSQLLKNHEVTGLSDAYISLPEGSIRLAEADVPAPPISLAEADLQSADLRGAPLQGTDLASAVFRSADLSEAKMLGAYMPEADLSDANLSDADLSGAFMPEADLSDADLRSADLIWAFMFAAKLSDADLRSADLRRARLNYANLSSAPLSKADLRQAHLIEANLSEADLRGADLDDADLDDANLDGANLRGAKNLTQVQLDSAKGNNETQLPRNLATPNAW